MPEPLTEKELETVRLRFENCGLNRGPTLNGLGHSDCKRLFATIDALREQLAEAKRQGHISESMVELGLHWEEKGKDIEAAFRGRAEAEDENEALKWLVGELRLGVWRLARGDERGLYGFLFAHPTQGQTIVTCKLCDLLLTYEYEDGEKSERWGQHREGCPVPTVISILALTVDDYPGGEKDGG
jgi:hypothetical protein